MQLAYNVHSCKFINYKFMGACVLYTNISVFFYSFACLSLLIFFLLLVLFILRSYEICMHVSVCMR